MRPCMAAGVFIERRKTGNRIFMRTSTSTFKAMMLASVLLLSHGMARAQQQTTVVTGTVLDSASGTPLRGVTVRVIDTTSGAISNASGRFLLRLPPGAYVLSFSMVGYRTARCDLTVAGDSVIFTTALGSAPLALQGVVVTAEDPGVKLMRGVLAKKLRQRDSLRTYSYMLYTKIVASTDTLTAGRSEGAGDTTIVSIAESYSRGYYRTPDSYFNQIVQRRQSANVPPQSNLVAFGTSLNAYDDYVTILGEEIATPFHPDATEYYEFVLERIARTDSGGRTARVAVRPKGNGRKLFAGHVDIDPDRLIPLGVELRPNRAVGLPFDADLHYSQRFNQIGDLFAMPTGMRIDASLQADLFWIIAPRLDITIETVAYDYSINPPLDGELFEQRRVELSETVNEIDSAYWLAGAVLPLRPEEARAYENIRTERENPDSLASVGLLERVFGPITREIGRLNRRPFTGLEDVFRYNRIHGAYLGLGIQGDLSPYLEAAALAGYGFSDRRPYGELRLTTFLDHARKVAVSGTMYSRLARRDNPYIVSTSGITVGSLLAKNDYGDYYYADGFEASIVAGFGQLQFIRRDIFARPTNLRLFARSEDHRNAVNRTNFAVLGWNRSFRENPIIIDGRLRSVGFELHYNYNPQRRLGSFGAQVAGELARPDLFGGDFRFEQYQGALQLRTRTLPLWRLDLRLSGGYSRGAIPPQRFFSLESSFSSTASQGVFRTMKVKEFYGDRYMALSMEHNFGEVIPGVLRIPNIASFGIEFIALANIGWTGFSPGARFATLGGESIIPASTDITGERAFYEAGIGLNRVLIFFRTDLTVRLSQTERPGFFFTISSAGF